MPGTDPDSKSRIIHEFGRLRAAGQPVPPELYAQFVQVTNDNYSTGPEVGQPVPGFTLPDQQGRQRAQPDMTGPKGLLLVFYRSADW